VKQEDARVAGKFDANDWIWQTYAYDRHNVGGGAPYNGDYKAAAVQGHLAGATASSADVDFTNKTIIGFLGA
jgi:hypothetical protein